MGSNPTICIFIIYKAWWDNNPILGNNPILLRRFYLKTDGWFFFNIFVCNWITEAYHKTYNFTTKLNQMINQQKKLPKMESLVGCPKALC